MTKICKRIHSRNESDVGNIDFEIIIGKNSAQILLFYVDKFFTTL